jgi:hypothetical protein
VTVGGTRTVGLTALVVAVPALFVKTALNRMFLSATVADRIVRVEVLVVPVAVLVTVPAAATHVDPPSVDCCHAAVGVGDPVAAAVNVSG